MRTRIAIAAACLALLNLVHAAEATDAAPASPAALAAPDASAASSDDSDVPPLHVYMVARIKLNGTDFTQVVFFRHNAITSLDDCEAERTAGLSTGWNHFSRYYLKTLKGISYKVDYRCVEGEQELDYWRKGVPLDHFYLVQTRDNKLVVTPQRNFFDCRDALKAQSREEDIDLFCGISSQAIVTP